MAAEAAGTAGKKITRQPELSDFSDQLPMAFTGVFDSILDYLGKGGKHAE